MRVAFVGKPSGNRRNDGHHDRLRNENCTRIARRVAFRVLQIQAQHKCYRKSRRIIYESGLKTLIIRHIDCLAEIKQAF